MAVDDQTGHVLQRRETGLVGLDHRPPEVHPREELAALPVDPHGVHVHPAGGLDPGQPDVVVDQLDRAPELGYAQGTGPPGHRVQPEHAVRVREPDAHEPRVARLHVHREQVFRVPGVPDAKPAGGHAGQRFRGPGLRLGALVVPAGRPETVDGRGQHAQVAGVRGGVVGGHGRQRRSDGGRTADGGLRRRRGDSGRRRDGRAARTPRRRCRRLLDAPARHHPAAGQRELGPFPGQHVIDVHLVQDHVALFARPPVPQPDPARLQPHRLVRVLELYGRGRRDRSAAAAAAIVPVVRQACFPAARSV